MSQILIQNRSRGLISKLLTFLVFALPVAFPAFAQGAQPWWTMQSVDTMKFSRDVAREKLNDPTYDQEIKLQVALIKELGATHVAIGTPYDEEFVPFLRRWVQEVRRQGLKVWFRGNMSGWEGWFNYPKITKEEHTEGVVNFILNNPDLFEDGDYFSSCPECENGALGDPRLTGQVDEYKKFLVDEHRAVADAFHTIGKQVHNTLYSMNGDVAKLIMDEFTTALLGGIVTIDHYVKTKEQFIKDVEYIAQRSKGKIVIGETGAPIPDIHGNISHEEQANYLKDLLNTLQRSPHILGVNYWVLKGGSTALIKPSNEPYPAFTAVKEAFIPPVVSGTVQNTLKQPLFGVEVKSIYKTTFTDANGYFSMPVLNFEPLSFSKEGYKTAENVKLGVSPAVIVLEEHARPLSWWQKLIRFLQAFFGR